MAETLKNFIGGHWVSARGSTITEILNPADGRTVVARRPDSTKEDVTSAVAAAAQAWPGWRETPMVRRCRILFHCKELLEQQRESIAKTIVEENGKTFTEAEGEVRRGIEVVEFAAGMPSLAKGDFLEDNASRVDGYIYREPLGVAVGACPFNFPVMIPLWMFPVAIACGNTFVLKPSDKCPVTGALIADIFHQGGLPPGVLNVLHGGGETFQALIASPEVAAVSIVGSTPAAESVWQAATRQGKRVQALGGAKNYIIVMPDAEPKQTIQAIINSSYGCAGERCMASSALVLVGAARGMLDAIANAARETNVGDGMKSTTQMGPVISAAHKRHVEEYIAIGQQEGARLVLDGRGVRVEGLPEGNFIGPTIFDQVKPTMRIAQEEIFGPVLSVMYADTLDEAISIANTSQFGNAVSIFTASGGAARKVRHNAECGMIGINVGVPAPMAFFSFGGRKRSFYGDLRAHGPDSVDFYTRKKAVIERWFGEEATGSVWAK